MAEDGLSHALHRTDQTIDFPSLKVCACTMPKPLGQANIAERLISVAGFSCGAIWSASTRTASPPHFSTLIWAAESGSAHTQSTARLRAAVRNRQTMFRL